MIDKLLESANPWKNLQSEAQKLSSKWTKTGLLAGIKGEVDKNNMSMILENQAKQLVVEKNQTGGGTAGATFVHGTGEQWAGIALPMVRKIFGNIAAKEFVSVQPMNLPSGLVFYLDFQYGTDKAPFKAGDSLYGTPDKIFGHKAEGGLYGTGRYSYTINDAIWTGSIEGTGSVTWADFNYDDNFSSSFGDYKKVEVVLPAQTDFSAARAFTLESGSNLTVTDNLPAFTTTTGQSYSWETGSVTFILPTNKIAGIDEVKVNYTLQTKDNKRGDFEDGNATLNPSNSPSISIPEINVQLKSEPIVAKTRKLKAVWTPEFAQDLNAYQALDAEAELTSIMSEYISLEIDLEILDMLINDAVSTDVWSAMNNRWIDKDGNYRDDLDFYNTQGAWFQTLGTKIQKMSNEIHQKTLRGGANFIVVSPKMSTIIESIPGFASNNDGSAEKMQYAFGVAKSGTMQNKYNVYKNPYQTENIILLGFRGGQFLEAGAVFSPYVPLIMTPLIYDPNTFTPRKGLLTRYAKKMIRPEFYGTIKVTGLDSL